MYCVHEKSAVVHGNREPHVVHGAIPLFYGGGMYYTYVLRSERDGKLYIGFSNDVFRRFSEHTRGSVPTTCGRLPVTLLFYEAFLSKSDALRRESYFKSSKGKSSLRQMLRESLLQ